MNISKNEIVERWEKLKKNYYKWWFYRVLYP